MTGKDKQTGMGMQRDWSTPTGAEGASYLEENQGEKKRNKQV